MPKCHVLASITTRSGGSCWSFSSVKGRVTMNIRINSFHSNATGWGREDHKPMPNKISSMEVLRRASPLSLQVGRQVIRRLGSWVSSRAVCYAHQGPPHSALFLVIKKPQTMGEFMSSHGSLAEAFSCLLTHFPCNKGMEDRSSFPFWTAGAYLLKEAILYSSPIPCVEQ